MKRILILALMVAGAAANAQVVRSGSHKIMIFGGSDHKVYLGCLSCSSSASDSVLNSYGPHGSKYSSESIFNTYGDYGGKYSSGSPCNSYPSDPPVIVDEDGGYYGELTIDTTRSRRAQSEILNSWLAGVCQGQ
ncbi:MAG: hypothetical protein WBD25_13965 [Terriglobales bacterium]